MRVVLAALILAGCSTYAAQRYAISADTVATLRTFRGQQVTVGPFTAKEPGRTEIMCRGVGPIKTPDGEPFEEFIRKAFITELTIAELYATTAPTVLTGRLDEIDFNSGEGSWTLTLALGSSTTGGGFTVREDYTYTSSFYGETACNQTAQALMPAVQNLVRKAVSDPAFRSMLQPRATAPARPSEAAVPAAPVTPVAAPPSASPAPAPTQTEAPAWCRGPRDIWTGSSCHERQPAR